MPATRHPACCPLASPLPDSAVLAALHSGRDYRRARPHRRRHGGAKPDSRLAGGVATAETSLGEAVERIVARGYQSKIRTEVAGPIWDQPVILGSLSPPRGYKSEITLDQHTSAKTEA